MKKKVWLKPVALIVLFIIAVGVVFFVITRPKIPDGILGIRTYNSEWASFEGEKASALPCKIDTKEDMEWFKFNVANKTPSLYKAIIQYEDSFFEDNSLIIYHLQQTGFGYKYEVESISCFGSTFQIKVRRAETADSSMSTIGGWIIVIEAEDELVSKCTKFKETKAAGKDFVSSILV